MEKENELGADCLANTFDDDNNNVGNDDCPPGFEYSYDICGCVIYENFKLCPNVPFICQWTGFDTNGEPECDCIENLEDLETLKEKAAYLGDDCIAGTYDDDDDNVGDDDCPEGYTYDYDICNCVTKDDPECPPTPPNSVCVWDMESDPAECDCWTETDYADVKKANVAGPDCILGTEDDKNLECPG